jgi:Flp pilus assembly pilin Flp
MTINAIRTHAGRFLREESGAVTVDWVVLTAVVPFMILGIILIYSDANEGLAVRVSDRIDLIQAGPGGTP